MRKELLALTRLFASLAVTLQEGLTPQRLRRFASRLMWMVGVAASGCHSHHPHQTRTSHQRWRGDLNSYLLRLKVKVIKRGLKDILRETPAFQQILEEGREEGLELERQRTLQSLRQKMLNLVQMCYGELFSFAQEWVPLIEQVEVLEDLFFKIAIATTVEEARTALLAK